MVHPEGYKQCAVVSQAKPGIGRTLGSHPSRRPAKKQSSRSALSLVHPEGFEPTTPCSEDKCSNPLSYGCTREIIAFFKIEVIRYQLEVGFRAVYLTRFRKLSYI